MALSKRGLTALAGVGLDEVVLHQLAIPLAGRMIHPIEGSPYPIPYGDFGEKIYSVSRQLLNQLLLDETEARGVRVHFEKELRSLSVSASGGDQQVDLGFWNLKEQKLQKVAADFVLGCDGAYSIVRRELLKLDRYSLACLIGVPDEVVRVDFSQRYIEHGYKEFSIPPSDDNDFCFPEGFLHIWPRKQFMFMSLANPVHTRH